MTDQPTTAGRRSLLALLLGGTVAAVTLIPTPAEADDDVIDGGTP